MKRMLEKNDTPVAIIGGGPVGLAAAAQLAKRNIPFLVLESGPEPGHHIRSWEHVQVFSPWKYNIDKAARGFLEAAGWEAPDPEQVHTGAEFLSRYLLPLSRLPVFSDRILTNTKVIAVGRSGMDKMRSAGRDTHPFVLQLLDGQGLRTIEARAVIDASGTWRHPNPVGSGGYPVPGEEENAKHLFYGIPDPLGKHWQRYKNRSVAVIGSGHSAIQSVLELEKLKQEFPQTSISWVLRKKTLSAVFGGGEKDALEARGALGLRIEALVKAGRINVYTPFFITEIRRRDESLQIIGGQNGRMSALSGIDEVIVNTGARPDFSFLREIRMDLSPALESAKAIADLIDPNVHSCGTVRPHGEKELRHPEKDFYIVGSKSYGRAPTFLMATGYEQVRSIAAALDGDHEAAERVELDLPETGVCSSGETSCCAPQASSTEQSHASCCV